MNSDQKAMITHMFGSDSHVESWVRMCWVSVVLFVKVFAQVGSSHLYGRLPVWVLRCRARLLESPNVFPHPGYSQLWGFSPVCTRACTCKAERYGQSISARAEKVIEQNRLPV